MSAEPNELEPNENEQPAEEQQADAAEIADDELDGVAGGIQYL